MDPIRERTIMKLLSDDPSCILLLRSKCTTDNMWKVVIQLEPSLFQYMKDPSNEMCLYALKEDGSNLQYVVKNPSVKLTSEMIYTAVNNYPAAIFDVPAEMRDNAIKEFALALMVGVLGGTYSSICITGPLWYYMRTKLTKKEKAKAGKAAK